MSVITISRQLGSQGTEIAQLLCDGFKYQCLDKESLEAAFDQYGIPKDSVDRYDEKKPGIWDIFKTDKARYLHFMKGVFFEFARKGNCVMLGRGGQAILGNIPGVLHVRVVAPWENRVERIMERYECDKRHAEKVIHHTDNERAGFHKFFFDYNWEDVNLYDLVLNTGSFSPDAGALLIRDVAEGAELKSRQKETELKLADLSLEHKIKTGIVYDEKVSVQFLEVLSTQGVVTLRGIVGDSEDVEQCEKIAAALGEVKEVRNEIYFKPIATTYGLHY
ncbi:MAG: BON domain-containing protein [bacterium]|nr:BON domain-containing protein [bacterium]